MSLQPKILFLLHFPPPVHGSSTVGRNIKNSVIVNKEYECYYINLLASTQLTEEGKINFGKIFDFLATFVKVLVLLVKKRPQLCYLALTSTGLAFYRDLALVALLKLFCVRRVYHLHNKGISLNQHKTINRISYRFVFQNADVILLSNRLYSDIQAFVPKSNVHICPNGISDETLNPNFQSQLYVAKRRDQIEKEPVQILFLSNLLEAKGVFVLLNACALLKKKEVCFKCIFVGGENDITAAQFNNRASQLSLNEQVYYLGKKYGEEKYRTFAESDIFAFPTYFETFGLVNLEAMQHSLPIVSTYEGGIPDIIEDKVTGFLVPKNDPVALAEKLELLIKDADLRHQIGLAGRAKYEREFTLEIFENRFTEILYNVIENRTPQNN